MLEILIICLVITNLLHLIAYGFWIKIMIKQHLVSHALNLKTAALQEEWHNNQKEINNITEIRNKEAHDHLIKVIDEGKINIMNPNK